MVAPNGARRTTADHPALPVTIPQIVETARRCFEAGADGIHTHVRDEKQNHVLDGGLYRELIAELARVLPGMQVQITTEAVGLYTPARQRHVVREVMPASVSVALKEMLSDGDAAAARRFYWWMGEAGISVQHIMYRPEEIAELGRLVQAGIVPGEELKLLFVLGRYAAGQESRPEDLNGFVGELEKAAFDADWAVCAFGRGETECLVEAGRRGGKLRVGFENNLWNSDGSIARDNAERVREVARRIEIGTC